MFDPPPPLWWGFFLMEAKTPTEKLRMICAEVINAYSLCENEKYGQFYIKHLAKLNVCNQCGTNHMVARYSDVYETTRQNPLKNNL